MSDIEQADAELTRTLRVGWLGGAPARYELTRFVLLRAIGFIYAIAFAIVCAQWEGLIGARGLLPAVRHVERLRGSFWEWPTLFVWSASDAALRACGWLGLTLAMSVVLGVENAVVMFALWAIYLSFCHVGQIFWGYGWEILLLEAGFLATFLCPLRSILPLRAQLTAPQPVLIMLRWLALRVMLGAGLIKLRGDPCWRDLTCLAYHYETQPVPGPLSAVFHHAPLWFHKAGTLFNHFVELVVPFGVFGPRKLRYAAGALIIAFQAILILSGNLSFLNWLTIVVALACFDDALLERFAPGRLRERAAAIEARTRPSRGRNAVLAALSLVVVLLSYGPVVNMLSPGQAMNTSFDPLHLVNSYGAFGTVGRVRHEVILQGSSDTQLGPRTRFVDYELPCKPGNVHRAPCWITPYHYRLDWQMWFAAMSEVEQEPWLVHLVYKLLKNEPAVMRLFAKNPFPKEPPRFVRAELYEYRFAARETNTTWQRTRLGAYMDPVWLGHEGLARYLGAYGFAPR